MRHLSTFLKFCVFMFVMMTMLGDGNTQSASILQSHEVPDKPAPTLNVQGVLQRPAALPCPLQPKDTDAGADDVIVVLWFKDDNDKPVYRYDHRDRSKSPVLWSSPTTFGARASFRTGSRPADAELTLEPVRNTDAGAYRCRVDFANSPTRNFRINFTVIIPPDEPAIYSANTWDQSKLLEPFNEGEDVQLACQTHGGDPLPSVVWFLDSKLIDDSFERRPDGSTVNLLTFPKLERRHLHSRLVCQANNTSLAPPRSRSLVLEINLKPLTVKIAPKRREVLAEQASVQVECATTGSRPDALLSWWKGARQIKKGIKALPPIESSSTRSQLTFVPLPEDHETYLICKAENPRLPSSHISDQWQLNVHYHPIVTAKIITTKTLDGEYIREGDDVYVECTVKANPKIHRLAWYKGSQLLQHNASAGVIINDHVLYIRNVNRAAAGDYKCRAYNSRGGSSASVVLKIGYAPSCKAVDNIQIHYAQKEETVSLNCTIDSSPLPSSFAWTFSAAAGNQMKLKSDAFTSSGETSILKYKPSKDIDFGTIFCSATNSFGRQEVPCAYKIVSVGPPSPLQNCSAVIHNSSDLQVECIKGFDGGLPQIFSMEVLEIPSSRVRKKLVSNTTPSFEVPDLDRTVGYSLNLYASNLKGRSEIAFLYINPLQTPNAYIEKSTRVLTSMLLTIVIVTGLLCTGICGIIAALYRRHLNRERCDKQPPFNDSFQLQHCVESIPKQDNGSPKTDYNDGINIKIMPEMWAEPITVPAADVPGKQPSISSAALETQVKEVHKIFSGRCLPPEHQAPFCNVMSRSESTCRVDVSGACARAPPTPPTRHACAPPAPPTRQGSGRTTTQPAMLEKCV